VSAGDSVKPAPPCALEEMRDHAIIAGFGVPGRAVAEMLGRRKVPFCVIELNAETVHRCAMVGVHIIEGSADSESVLRSARIEHAALLLLALPNDAAVLEAVRVARQLNPTLHIIARCRFISAGMEAHRRGATETIVEEQMVAEEFTRRLDQFLPPR
jgi:CPA2 family monovalent cation:H+ antiporter-2